jgi:hypothetical protein
MRSIKPIFLFFLFTLILGAFKASAAGPGGAMTCIKPFTIPDKWLEADGPWSPSATFDPASGDVYRPLGDPNGFTGFDLRRHPEDIGTQVTVKQGSGDNISPSLYNALSLPGSTGGNDYRNNISDCNSTVMTVNDPLIAKTGNMVGPTEQGIDDLIRMDPDAYWDSSTKSVQHSCCGISPRVAAVPLYDPQVYSDGKQSGQDAALTTANFIGVFIESGAGGSITGRLVPLNGFIVE